MTKNWHQNYGGRGRPVRLRRLLDHLALPAVPVRPRREAGHLLVQLRRGDRRHGAAAPTRTATSRRPPRSRPSSPSPTSGRRTGCFPNDASSGGIDVVASAGPGPDVEVYDSSTPAGAPPGSQSRFDCFRARFNTQVADELGAGLQLHHARQRPHRRHHARAAHAERDDGRERLRARPGGRPDLALADLEELADPRDRGRLPGRRRPRGRPPHPGLRDQPVRQARRGGAHALRLPLLHQDARGGRSA